MAERESLFQDVEAAIRHHEFAVLATLRAANQNEVTEAQEALEEARGRIIEAAQELYEQGGCDLQEALNRGL